MLHKRVLTILIGVSLLLFSQVHAADRPLDSTTRIAVMSAYAPEWQTLLSATTDQKEYTLNGKRFVAGKLEGKDVLLSLSGVSMVNAAMSAQLLIDHFKISSIVFSGIAGGVDPSLSIGDVVVVDQWGEYLESIFARETKGKFTPPEPSFAKIVYPNFGMMFPVETEVTRTGSDQPENRFWFPVDDTLLKTARTVAENVALEKCTGKGLCLTQAPKIVVGGNGVSGQSFVDNAKFRTYAFKTFHARVLDMESAAVAHVAYSNDVPFIAFRSLSDLAGGGTKANELGVFFAMAAANSAKRWLWPF